MKKFWKKHKHTIKYSLGLWFQGATSLGWFVIISLVIFDLINFWVGDSDYLFSKMGDLIFTDWKGMVLPNFLIPHVIALFYTFIPCVLSGLILNHYSVKDIENGRMAKYAIRRGLLFGFFSSAFISAFFVLAFGMDSIVFSLFLLSLALYAIIMGTTIGGAAGYFISAENVRQYEMEKDEKILEKT